MILLSIVVPIYNVEPFLEKCLRSLENQDIPHNEYEIICVNDGSPDNSREIVLNIQKGYNNVILIDQENQGVSVARNIGAEKAIGKYLLFIDPDDFIEVNSLSHILREVESHGAQMAIPGYTFVDMDGKVLGRKIFETQVNKQLTGIDAYYLSRKTGHIVTDTSVGVIFETDFLKKNNLLYRRGVILNQDVELLARIHCLADRCIFVNHFLYIATIREGSATHSGQFNREIVRKGFVLAADSLKRFQEMNSLNSVQKMFLNGPIAKFVLLSIYSGFRTTSLEKFRNIVNVLKLNGLQKLCLEGCSRYNKICGKTYNLSPYLAAPVIMIYLKINRLFQ